MAKHLVESPGVGGNHFVGIRRSADIRPFVETDRHRLCSEFRDALQILLIVLVFRPDLGRWRSLPLDQALRTDIDFFTRLKVGSLSAGGVEMLAEHIHVVETMR